MKVLVVARSFLRGGSATGAVNLAHALEAAGLTVIRESGDGKRPLLRKAERVFERALPNPQETHALRLGPPSLDLDALVRLHAPDIVQLCDLSGNTIAMDAPARLPCPSVHRMSDFWPYHGPAHYAQRPSETPPGLAQILYDRAGFGMLHPTMRVAPSAWLADQVAAAGSARPAVILNAQSVSPDIRPKTLKGGPLRLGFIANKLSDPRKGLAQLGPALRDTQRDVQLITFGKLPAAGDIPKAQHRGTFPRTQIAHVMSEIDILLCPYKLDNSPNTVTEAFAHGVPVIGQRDTGMDSYIDDTRGAHVDFWDETPQLDAVLDRISRDYAAHSAAALNFASKDLSPGKIGGAYAALYRELLHSPSV